MWTQLEKKNRGRCGSPVGGLQAIEPVVTVAIQTSLRCPVGHSSRKETQEESLEPIEDDQVHGDSSTKHPADHPGPLTCAEKRLSGRDCEENKKHTCCSSFVGKIPNLLLPAYLRCMSANLWCNIPSGVADADHHHPLPSQGRPIFVIPAVNARASKCIMSWRRKHDVYVLWRPVGQSEQHYCSVTEPGKSDRGSDGRTYWPEHTSTASKTCLSSRPSLSMVTTSHWPEAEKSGLCTTLFTLVWNIFSV